MTVRVYVVEKPHQLESIHFGCRPQALEDGWQIICQSYGPEYELWFRTCPVCGEPFSDWPGGPRE